MAEKIVVSVVDASGIRSAQTFCPPKTYQAVTGVLKKAFGVGCLVNGQGDTVTPDDPVAAGPYTYTVTGGLDVWAEAVVEASTKQLREDMARSTKQLKEDMARIQNELADVRRQMEDGHSSNSSSNSRGNNGNTGSSRSYSISNDNIRGSSNSGNTGSSDSSGNTGSSDNGRQQQQLARQQKQWKQQWQQQRAVAAILDSMVLKRFSLLCSMVMA
ncbi:hypothetical protein QJQ45_018842 [Haematococcus lacustris]|nr:hypothetical protein QJQ45_018842 [Haematococcus lacustris]